MSKKKSLLLFEDFFAITENLPIHCLGELWKALHCYIKGEEYNFVDAETKGCWNYIKIKLNENTEKWNETCKKRSEAGKRGMQKRYQTITNDNKTNKSYQMLTNDNKANKCYQMLTNANKCQQMLTDYDNDNENENNNIKEKNILKKEKKFVKPTIDEVKAYVDEYKYRINVEKFYSHYESNGWKVGRNPMKDWKASVRYWASDVGLGRQPDKQTEINYDNGFFNVERYCNG